MIGRLLTNRCIAGFEILEHAFCNITISGGYALTVDTLLRYVGADRAFVCNQDHEQRFGLPHPYNAAEEISKRVLGRSITSLEVGDDTGDLTLFLEDGRIEILCSSIGYENYQLNGPDGLFLVGRGGKQQQ